MFFVSCEIENGESVLWLCTVVRGSLAATKPVSGAESKRCVVPARPAGCQPVTAGSPTDSRAKKATVSRPVPVKSPAAVMKGIAALSGSTRHHQSQ